jgi:hypothetical protein
MFVRKKVVTGHTYYQLVETYRKDGKVRQRVLWHMGQDATIEEHLKTLKRKVKWYCPRAGEPLDRPCEYIAVEKLERFQAVMAGKEPPRRKTRQEVEALLGRKRMM